MRFKQFLVFLAAGALILPAQEGAPQQKLISQAKGSLKINVLEGEGGRNIIRSRTGVPPVIEVKDAADKPVPGAEVVFQLPMVGPSATFNGWLKTQTARTDEQGKATVTGFAPNTEAGRFNIKVTATSGTQTGSAVIAQTNVSNGGGAGVAEKKSGTWKILAVLGGVAVAGGVVAATRGGTSAATTTAATPVTVTPGAVTVGTPR